MTSAPSLEQFMTAEHDPEDDLEPVEQPASQPTTQSSTQQLPGGDPLLSIAHSLDRMLAIAEHHQLEETEADRLREAYDDLDAKHAVLYDLVEELEAIIKPSTSKLAKALREAIDRWRDPQAAQPAEGAGADAPPAPDPQLVPDLQPQTSAGVPPQPADDASVFEWQYYARCLGHPAATVDAMNRSQIRTLLGIPQPGTTPADPADAAASSQDGANATA